MSSVHRPGDAVLAAQGGGPCVPVSPCRVPPCRVMAARVFPLPLPAQSPLGLHTPHCEPSASLSWPGPGEHQGSQSPSPASQRCQLCSDQQSVMAAPEWSFVWLPHRLTPCQNVRSECEKKCREVGSEECEASTVC